MIEPLFEVGENEAGFYTYPVTNPPDHGQVAGDEVLRGQATALCDSLNHAVAVYVAQRMEQSQRAMYGVLGAISSWEHEDDDKNLEEFITKGMRRDLREAANAEARRPPLSADKQD